MVNTKPVKHSGWIGVDLDGTLAYYDVWRGEEHIGALIPAMAERVRRWLDAGIEVRIFTARVTKRDDGGDVRARRAIEAYTHAHFGQTLKVTNVKDYGLIQFWDDRAVGVIPNTGIPTDTPQRIV